MNKEQTKTNLTHDMLHKDQSFKYEYCANFNIPNDLRNIFYNAFQMKQFQFFYAYSVSTPF